MSSIDALKLSAEAFARRNLGTGLNTYDANAWAACKEVIKSETGEVLDVRTWTWKRP